MLADVGRKNLRARFSEGPGGLPTGRRQQADHWPPAPQVVGKHADTHEGPERTARCAGITPHGLVVTATVQHRRGWKLESEKLSGFFWKHR